MDNFNKRNEGSFDRGLWTVLGVIAVLAVTVMIYFLIEYPIPVIASGSWAKNNDYIMLYVGFAAIIGGIIDFMSRQKRKNAPSAPTGATAPTPQELRPEKRIQMIIAAVIWGALIAFVVARGILPGIMWALQNGS